MENSPIISLVELNQQEERQDILDEQSTKEQVIELLDVSFILNK